jgi:hypothetical protein
MVLRLPRQPVDLRRFAVAVSDVQRQWAVAVAYHSAVAVERLVAAVRGAVAPPSAEEAEVMWARVEELHRARFGAGH